MEISIYNFHALIKKVNTILRLHLVSLLLKPFILHIKI